MVDSAGSVRWPCGYCGHSLFEHSYQFRNCHAEVFHEKQGSFPMTRACDKGCQMFVPQYDTTQEQA